MDDVDEEDGDLQSLFDPAKPPLAPMLKVFNLFLFLFKLIYSFSDNFLLLIAGFDTLLLLLLIE